MSTVDPADDEPLVLIRQDGAVRTLMLNRPHKRNALNDALLARLADALREARADPPVRVIVLDGAGPCFCSGRDQLDAGAAGMARAVLQDGSLHRTVGALTGALYPADAYAALGLVNRLAEPTVASVHGLALAAGQALTLACDFVVAERDARFGNPEMRFGFPAAMNTVPLARHLGRRKALEIAITGALYPADAYAALNQLLRANAQLVPAFEDAPGTSERLRRELGRGDPP